MRISSNTRTPCTKIGKRHKIAVLDRMKDIVDLQATDYHLEKRGWALIRGDVCQKQSENVPLNHCRTLMK